MSCVMDLPLPRLFAICREAYQHMEQVPAQQQSDAYQKALGNLRTCQRMVDSLGLFSANEEQDELSTSSMKYLLVPFYIAEYLAASRPANSGARANQVQEALENYRTFLLDCEQYDLLGDLGTKLRYAVSHPESIDSSTLRTLKIEKFKRDKALCADIAKLESSSQHADSREQDSTEQRAVGGPSGLDEEDERKLWALVIEVAVLKAQDQERLLKMEGKLLEESKHSVRTDSAALAPPSDQDRVRMIGQLQGIAAQLETSQRERLKRQVFQPSHSQPTMTLAQLADIELNDARVREDREARQRAAVAAADAALTEDERDARDAAKQRSWDDWKDANPRGSGNSKLTPCG